ncbi:hypothetical protein QC761_601530 [Podospora bellae-mahoneyi]|uniref:Uncharacterized protein n=1 Tax=Podospora bellae-mahoneyi TaxID=2093777 RepID=A0ABR0FCV7_9PEZI|nr:hypothetical protein QC761_601530 [Podospora bellae-mahoneyi]
MKLTTTLQAVIGSASFLFAAQPALAGHVHGGHRHAHERYARRQNHHSHMAGEVIGASRIAARKAPCSLPDDPDLVRVPGDVNNGFAMSPDEPCEDGKWCPIACRSGKVMAQWKPNTKYTYPESMYGGLYCDGGKPMKPFKEKPYCVDGTGAVKAVNKCGKVVSFCQTVLPGNEAMIIPTDVSDTMTLSVPDASYWAQTAAHYYVNPPGVDASKGCVWGKITEAIGNWSPYVAGANTQSSGETFVKIAWNPEYMTTDNSKNTPTYGLKIECPDGGCNGLPCVIDPTKSGVGGVESPNTASVDGGANFCVVTVPKGKTANIVVFNTDGSTGEKPKPKEEPKPKPKEEPKPTPKPEPTTVAKVPKTTAAPPSTTTEAAFSIKKVNPTTSKSWSSESTSDPYFMGGIFLESTAVGKTKTYSDIEPTATAETVTTTEADGADSRAAGAAAASTSPSNEGGAADHGGSAIAGLVVAIVAAAALL